MQGTNGTENYIPKYKSDMNTQAEYPKFYRKDGKCVKVASATETRTIILPPESRVAERYSTTYPTADRLLESLAGLEEVTEQTFKEFLFTFYQSVNHERSSLTV
jgi:hypothetical protein